MKVVINKCFGGFGLSAKGVEAYLARKGKQVWWFTDARDENGRLAPITTEGRQMVPTANPDEEFIAYSYTTPEPTDDGYFYARDIERDDPDLVAVVEELRKHANGQHAELSVIEIPDGIEFHIEEYDGLETVHESHRSWS